MNNPYGNLSQGQPPAGGYGQPPAQGQPPPGYAPTGHAPPPGYAPTGHAPPPGYAPPSGYAPPNHAPPPGYAPPTGHAPPSGYAPTGHAPPGYAPPPGQGFVSYGEGAAPPFPFTPSPGLAVSNELSGLDDDAQLWLMVAAGGFIFFLGWITGPLAWFFAGQIRRQFKAYGHHPCASANWAWAVGIVSTLIYYSIVALIVTGIILTLN